MHIYKIVYIKTFKMAQHVSILRSSSGRSSRLYIQQPNRYCCLLCMYSLELLMMGGFWEIVSNLMMATAALAEAVITVLRAPDDRCQHPKHVELPTEM